MRTSTGWWSALVVAGALVAAGCDRSDPHRADERGGRSGGAGTAPGDVEAGRAQAGAGTTAADPDDAAVVRQAGKSGAAEVSSGANPGASGSADVDQTGGVEERDYQRIEGGLGEGGGLTGGDTVATLSGQDRASAVGLGLDPKGGTVYEVMSVGDGVVVMKPMDESTTGAGSGERRNQAGYELSIPRAEADALGLAGVALKEGSRVIVVRTADGKTASIRPE